jgi:hypothetical protein
MMVFIPGGNVATEYYTDTAKAIQEASNLKLWIIVPSQPKKLCIPECTTPELCKPLKFKVEAVIGEAGKQGYTGKSNGDDVIMAGHSLGGACASTLSLHMSATHTPYSALVLMGSYVTD